MRDGGGTRCRWPLAAHTRITSPSPLPPHRAHASLTTPVAGRPDAEVAAESWAAFVKRNDSRIVDLFAGQFRSRVQCNQCSLVSLTFDAYTTLR